MDVEKLKQIIAEAFEKERRAKNGSSIKQEDTYK